MKLLLLLISFSLFLMDSSAKTTTFILPGDSTEIKKWTKEDFKQRLGFSDSAIALINLFFKKNQRGKNQIIIGGAFLIGGSIALAIPSEPGDDQKGFGDLIRPVTEPGAAAIGVILTTFGVAKTKTYTNQKLYSILLNYKNGNPISEAYRKKLKRKYFR